MFGQICRPSPQNDVLIVDYKDDMTKKIKTIKVAKIWSDKQWTVRFGSLNAGPGKAGGVSRLFRVVGEKIP